MDEIKQLNLLKEFPPVTTEQWEEVITRDLKGADYAKKLLWKTDDGITVKPYYRVEDLAKAELSSAGAPGAFPYTRGTKAVPGWAIQEQIETADPAKANEYARKALEDGADEICFVIESAVDGTPGVRVNSAQDVVVLLGQIALDKVKINFRAGSKAKQLFELLTSGLGSRIATLAGSIDYDPLGDLILTGVSTLDKKAIYDEAAKFVANAKKTAPKMKVLTVRGWEFHESGGTTVQELGFALAQAVEYVSELTDRGLTAEQVADAMFFIAAIGTVYFFEISKLRAARTLWAQVMTGFGVKPEAAKINIAAQTSKWGTTIYDGYVNALRETTETMSAAVGGADSIMVAPFDAAYKESDERGRRLARNTQIILKKEAYFDKIVDPAAGSYYVEVLTASIAREAWQLMQKIEGCGGFLKCLEDGWIQEGITKCRQAKDAAIAARRRNLLGTNQYPNQKERVLSNISRPVVTPEKPQGKAAITVEPLKPYRGAEVYEALRLRVERYVAAGNKTPRILLLEIGDLKMRKARTGFSANFFGCGGFEMVTRNASDIDSAVSTAVAAAPDAIVLCSSDAEYPVIAGPIIRKLRDAGHCWPVIVAGYPKDAIAALQQDGVADFIHIKSNAVEVIKTWQDKLGVRD